MSKASMKFELLVDDKGTVKVKKFGKTVDTAALKGGKFGQKMVAAGKGVASFTASAVKSLAKVTLLTAALVAASTAFMAGKTLTQFASFESALVDMGKVTDQSFGDIRKQILELPPALGDSTDLVRGYYQVISAGVTEPKAAMETLIGTAQLAKTAHAEHAEVVAGATSIMDAFGVNVTEAADAMQTMEKSGKTSVKNLIPIIGEISTTSSALGISLDEMGAGFAAVTKFSGGTEKAATQYKAVMISLLSPTTQMAELLKSYGGAQQAIKDMGFAGVLDVIAEASEGSAEKTKQLMGSAEGFLGFMSLTNSELKTYTANLEEMKNKTGSGAEAWENYKKTLTAIWDTFQNTIGKQVIMIGEQLAPAIKEALTSLGSWLDEMRDPITAEFAYWITTIVDNARSWKTALVETVAQVREWYAANKELIAQGVVSFLEGIGAAAGFVADHMGSFLTVLKGVVMMLNAMLEPIAGVIRGIGIMVEKIQGLSATKALVEFTGIGSSEKPLSEKIDEMTGKITEYQEAASLTSTSLIEMKANAGSGETYASEGINSLSDTFSGVKSDLETPITLAVDTSAAESALSSIVSYYTNAINQAQQNYAQSRMDALDSIQSGDRYTHQRMTDAKTQNVNIAGLQNKYTSAMFQMGQTGTGQQRNQTSVTNNYNTTVSPTFMTGDRNAAQNVGREIATVLDARTRRIGR